MSDSFITGKLFTTLAADPIPPLLQFPRIARNTEHELHEEAISLMAALPQELLRKVVESGLVELHEIRRQDTNFDQFSREMAAIEFLNREISSQRVIQLSSDLKRPAPYNVSAIADLEVDLDGLVPLHAFEFNGSTLSRNGHCFMLTPPAEAPNSAYWLLQHLGQRDISNTVSIRLDPYLHGPSDSFPQMFYRMDVYGRPLDWDRIGQLKEAEHGQWLSDKVSEDHKFTDYVWDPRSDGIHFICEELPNSTRTECQGARYLHSIYSPSADKIIHLDGALRFYTDEELKKRRSQHVRSAGKIGRRVKLFRTDTSLPKEVMTGIAAAFFLWNEDAQRYFGG